MNDGSVPFSVPVTYSSGVASPDWSAAILTVVEYTWNFPAVTCQKVPLCQRSLIEPSRLRLRVKRIHSKKEKSLSDLCTVVCCNFVSSVDLFSNHNICVCVSVLKVPQDICDQAALRESSPIIVSHVVRSLSARSSPLITIMY